MDEEKVIRAEEETMQEETEQETQEPGGESPVATEDEWRAALETAVKQRDDYLAMAQRTQADFQNFKRRNQSMRTDAYDEGVRDTMTNLLPSIDNLERAIASAEESEAEGPLLEGVRMTLKLLMESMGKLGLGEVPALGEIFDPEKHNAVMRTEEGEPGTVLEVFQKGYKVKDRIIRYAMVKVAAD